MISVRYIVADVEEAVEFYQDNLDFKVDKHNPGKFAALVVRRIHAVSQRPRRGKRWSGGRRPDAWRVEPVMIVTKELDVLIERLRRAHARFRGDISDGGAGRAICLKILGATSSSYSSTRRTEASVPVRRC
ncbi:MAG: VOC family protein [Mesorhizobium sp.]|nr:VOC family protein [bacterium M00.F.Ca.ET.205.01.1.1]TGU49380.1 VOC family protein [bacterium M00.F.Ca.ET.152.01.1.1]TGV33479.1 VOC family protein [Mesorhizobium sp. M00.F.Ca.ET.186.01.1.1]TGZ40383.1 VOC family protein [bacterium M00.F.Ca.ET.162.01.1.1]TIW63122.1 MAG: VOC family protein [Mesorhizobium sp.]